ncbi:MAG: DMT family transporter [Deinococcales bacterium]
MTLLALALVLAAAFLHATWNLLAKRAQGAAEFVWLFATLTLVAYAPAVVAYLLIAHPVVRGVQVLFAAVSSVIHVGYFVTLQRGYRAGDLSLVYPLARGSGPALAALMAIGLLGERPGGLGLAGGALVVVSVFVLTGGGARTRAGRPALLYGLGTGLFIGVYTVWDGYAVAHLGAPPLLYSYLSEAGRALLLAPVAWRGRGAVAAAWRESRGAAWGIAVLSPLAYILVLTAMTFTPISLVAPAREISILVGTLMGTRLLAEGQGSRRLVGALGMVAGVALLALA